VKKLLLFSILVLLLSACTFRVVPEGGSAYVPSPPTIRTFEAAPSLISPGDTSVLSWTVADANTVSIDQGVGNVALTGSRTITPAATTIYTLIATNAAGTTVTATAQVTVSATSTPPAIPEPTPPPPSPGFPVISYFTGNPPSITAGDITTLSWGVSNATAVTIDQGIGDVGLVGTAPVSPAATMSYTLTATNAAGWQSMTITVVVASGPPPASEPDLVITDISRSGSTISYTIKNQGTATAGPSTSRLTVDGVTKASDAVGPLSAGASSTESFSYSYSCSGTGDSLAVQADKDNVVSESDEGNNAYTKYFSCLLEVGPLVIPGPLLSLAKPDLVLVGIWESGDRIHYKIKNQGSKDSVASTSELWVSGAHKTPDDAVPVIAAGATVDRVFGYVFSCSLPLIKTVEVRLDVSNSNIESDETNNKASVPALCH
jgi:hypothetical protein